MITVILSIVVILLSVVNWCILNYCKILKEEIVDLEVILGDVNNRITKLENKPTDQ